MIVTLSDIGVPSAKGDVTDLIIYVDTFATLHLERFNCAPAYIVYQQYIYACIRRRFPVDAFYYVIINGDHCKIDLSLTTDETKPDIQLGMFQIYLTLDN